MHGQQKIYNTMTCGKILDCRVTIRFWRRGLLHGAS